MAHKIEDKELWKMIDRVWKNGPNKKDMAEQVKIYTELKMNENKELTPIQKLENILINRLPYINRWKSVKVESYKKYFVIVWSTPRGDSMNTFETREIKYEHLNTEIERHSLKLINERKKYNGSIK